MQRERILVLCTANSARSQMAEGLLRRLGGDRVEALSAGSRPAEAVNPYAVRVMAEVGIDISGYRPKHGSEFVGQPVDWVVIVCSRAAANALTSLGARAELHWFHDDPAAVQGTDEEIMMAFQMVRGDLARRLGAWLALSPEERAHRAEAASAPPTLVPPCAR